MLLLESRPILSASVFSVAVLTKPQSIAIAPILAFMILKKYGWRSVFKSFFAAVATVIIVILPLQRANPVGFLVESYLRGYTEYRVTSAYAFNIWGFVGYWKSDNQTFLFLNLFTIGWILFIIMAAFSIFLLERRFDVSGDMLVIFTAFILLFSFFMLPTRIHERYLYPALSVLALMIPFIKKMRFVYVVLTFTFITNQAYSMYLLNSNQAIFENNSLTFMICLINLLVFLYVLLLMWKELEGTTFIPKCARNEVNMWSEKRAPNLK